MYPLKWRLKTLFVYILNLCSMNRTIGYGDFFLNGVRILRVCFCGRYLKTEIDHNYG